MEIENRLITNLDINTANLEHINTIDKLIDIISNLDNSAFKTLLSYYNKC